MDQARGVGGNKCVDGKRGSSGSPGFIIPEQFQMLPTDKTGLLKFD